MSKHANQKKLRLCYIADLRSLHTQKWVDYFVQRGHSITVLSPTKMRLPGVKVHSIFWRPGFPKIFQLANVLPVFAILRACKPDVLHAHYARVYGWLAALSFFKPLVITVWGGDILEDQGAFSDVFGKRLTPFALRRASLVTAHSRFLRNRVIELGAPENRVTIVGCPGIDRKQFRNGLDTSSLRNELASESAPDAPTDSGRRAIWEDAPVILCPRLIRRLYNTETLIRAIPLVLKEIPSAKFLFSELAGEKLYIQEMKVLAGKLDVGRSTIFLEQIPRARMPLFLNLASVFVSIPDSDGMPQSLLETMSCGTVPIVSDLPQYAELIRNEINALVVPPRDVDALATAIIRLIKDDALRERLSRACIATVMEGMDYENEMAKMERLYYELSRIRDSSLSALKAPIATKPGGSGPVQ